MPPSKSQAGWFIAIIAIQVQASPWGLTMEAAFLGILAIWLIPQALALWLLKGRWRAAAWMSAAAMLLALAVGILGGLAGSNIAPIWIVLALPVCMIWIVGLWVIHGLARWRRG